jgi:hypothetical protein
MKNQEISQNSFLKAFPKIFTLLIVFSTSFKAIAQNSISYVFQDETIRWVKSYPNNESLVLAGNSIYKLSANLQLQWKKTYLTNIEFDKIEPLNDGGFYHLGRMSYTNTYSLNKYASNGDLIWKKEFINDSDGNSGSFNAVLLQDQGFLVFGISEGQGIESTTSFGGKDLWVMRLDKNGNTLWAKNFGGSGDEISYFTPIITKNKQFILSVLTYSNDGMIQGNAQAGLSNWIIQLNIYGNITKQILLQGSENTYINKLLLLKNNNLLVAADVSQSGGMVNDHFGQKDGWIALLDANLSLLWSKTLGGSSDDYINKIAQSANNTIYVQLHSHSTDGTVPDGNKYAKVVTLSNDGEILLAKSFAASDETNIVSINPNPYGGYYGYTLDSLFLLKSWDEQGELKWTYPIANFYPQIMNDNSNILGIEVLKDSSFLIANGLYYVTYPTINHQSYLTKLDKNGLFKWEKSYSGNKISIRRNNSISTWGNKLEFYYIPYANSYSHRRNGMLKNYVVPNFDGVDDRTEVKPITIFPNPTTSGSVLQFRQTDIEGCSVIAYDLSGRVVFIDKIQNQAINLQSFVPSGSLTLHVVRDGTIIGKTMILIL